ncbi:unnamed protein product [Urochloa humidicola]
MPSRVEKLQHLQTLDARDTLLHRLPENVIKLVKLERLEFNHRLETRTWILQRGIREMKALRELHLVRLPNDVQVANELGELQNLQHIGIYIDCQDNPQVLQKLALSLSNLYSLRRLNISNMSYVTGGSLNFLNDMAAPRQLRLLRLEGVLIGGSLPQWVSSLTSLVKTVIRHTNLTGDHLFDDLCELPKLKTIVMEKDCYVGTELVARPRHGFPALSQLIVSGGWIGMNPQVFEFQAGSMVNLETLCVNFGEQQRRIDGIENLTTKLREVILVGRNDNASLGIADEEANRESRNRGEGHQFRVSVTYY